MCIRFLAGNTKQKKKTHTKKNDQTEWNRTIVRASKCNQFLVMCEMTAILLGRYISDRMTVNKCVRRSVCVYIYIYMSVCFMVLWLAVKYTQIYNHQLNKRNNLADFFFACT